MTQDDLQNKLKSDVKACLGLAWPKDISKHLVIPPRLEKFDEAGQSVEMWIVFDEDMESSTEGYLILVDPDSNDYYLAIKGSQMEATAGTVIGHSGGSLREAIEGL